MPWAPASQQCRPVPRAGPRGLRLVEGGDRSFPLRRDSVQRRLLALADVLSATLALWLVLTIPGSGDAPGLAMLAAIPLLVLIFKMAGLYDRDQLRIVHSTLDELPLLLQLTGLYVLGVTILQSVAVQGTLGGAQIAALWAVTLLADRRRPHARPLRRRPRDAGRALPRHRRPRPRRADPREARQQRRPHHGRGDVPARGRRRQRLPGRAQHAPDRRRARRPPDRHRPDDDRLARDRRPDPRSPSRPARRSACCRGCSRSSAPPSSSRTSTA